MNASTSVKTSARAACSPRSGLAALAVTAGLLAGCASPGVMAPNDNRALTEEHWFPQLMRSPEQQVDYLGPALPYSALPMQGIRQQAPVTAETNLPPARPPLSPGDRVRVTLATHNLLSDVFHIADTPFNGLFEVDIDGSLNLPYLAPLPAAGLTTTELRMAVNRALEQAGIFRPGMAHANVALVQWAPVSVYISGAVFQPGQHTINQRTAEDRSQAQYQASGDYPLDRLLPAGLRAAGGVRPDADISTIQLIRAGRVYHLDLSGLVLGYPVRQVPLMDGDQLRIASVGTAQRELVRPSPITPPGMRVFISNLTMPATNNASSALGEHATSLPYGANLLTAAVSGNCAGGSASTNSGRYAVLVTQDPVTQRAITVERDIHTLLRAPDRVDVNPYLMPNDRIVCYDSNVSDARDISRTIADLLLPLSLLL
ncbi:polysaccharide biosynthesis/export family protein [Onishia taeanensis]